MRKLTFSLSVALLISASAAGSLHSLRPYAYPDDGELSSGEPYNKSKSMDRWAEDNNSSVQAEDNNSSVQMDFKYQAGDGGRHSFFSIENALALDEPPAIPAAPNFSDLGEVFINDPEAFKDPGATLELWFRRNGVSERDIKSLGQLPDDQKVLIRKIVQAYQIDMRRTVLEMRPNIQKIRGDLDILKLELSRLVLLSEGSEVSSRETQAVIEEIIAKEKELDTLKGVEERLNAIFQREMTDQIAEVVNSWIAVQASKNKISLAQLFQEAEDTYGLKWE